MEEDDDFLFHSALTPTHKKEVRKSSVDSRPLLDSIKTEKNSTPLKYEKSKQTEEKLDDVLFEDSQGDEEKIDKILEEIQNYEEHETEAIAPSRKKRKIELDDDEDKKFDKFELARDIDEDSFFIGSSSSSFFSQSPHTQVNLGGESVTSKASVISSSNDEILDNSNTNIIVDREAVQDTSDRDFDSMPEMEKPSNLRVDLLLYQKQALHWMYNQEHSVYGSGILADDMGLGKTIEMISLILANSPADGSRQKTTLIVCPLSTLHQWSQEIRSKVKKDALKTHVYYGTRIKDPRELKKYDIVLTTYGVLCSDSTEGSRVLSSILWYRIILDEAQNIKNPGGKTAKAAWELKGSRRWCLTGTPIQNGLQDLYSLLRFIRADFCCEGPTWYVRNIIRPIRYGDTRGLLLLQKYLHKYLLRRTKTTKIRGQPILVLPACHRECRKITMSEDEKLFYDSLFSQAQQIFETYHRKGTIKKNYLHILELLLRLRQLCDSNLLVLMCLSESPNGKKQGQYEEAYEMLREMLKGLKEGNSEAAKQVVSRLFSLGSTCVICMDNLENSHVTPCGHEFCKSCIEGWLVKYQDLLIFSNAQQNILPNMQKSSESITISSKASGNHPATKEPGKHRRENGKTRKSR